MKAGGDPNASAGFFDFGKPKGPKKCKAKLHPVHVTLERVYEGGSISVEVTRYISLSMQNENMREVRREGWCQRKVMHFLQWSAVHAKGRQARRWNVYPGYGALRDLSR